MINNNPTNILEDKIRIEINLFFYLPMVLLTSVLQLIVRGKYIEPSDTTAPYWVQPEITIDFFTYYRTYFLMFFTFLAILSFLSLIILKKITVKKELKYYVPLALYIILISISAIFSVHREFSLFGFFESFENVFVLTTYMILVFLSMHFVSSKRELYIIRNSLVFLIIIEGVICISEFLGYYFLNSKIVQFFIWQGELIPGFFLFGESSGTMRGTLYNSNYIGSFATIILPLSVSFFLAEKNKCKRFFLYIVIVISIVTWLGCNSRAGYVGMIALILVSCFFLRKNIFLNIRTSLLLLISTVIIALTLNNFSDGRTLGQFGRLDLSGEIDKIQQTESDLFQDILLNKDSFSIVTKHETLTVKKYGDSLLFEDADKNTILASQDEENYIIEDNTYKNYSISHIKTLDLNFGDYTVDVEVANFGNVVITAYGRIITFTFTDEQAYIVMQGGRLTTPIVAPTFTPFDNYERFASNRGFIWSRSIMMLPDSGFFGYGPDTYATLFPQNDFVAKLNSGVNANWFVSKPHNMYLQIAINTGIPSLIALLALWAIYVLRGFKLYYKIEYDSIEKYFGFACMMAVIGYLVAGIFNDSKVEVAPLFWIILGIGISINELLIKAKKEGITYEEAIVLSGGVSIVNVDNIVSDISSDGVTIGDVEDIDTSEDGIADIDYRK